MAPVQDFESVWILHYEGEGDGDGDGDGDDLGKNDPPGQGKTYSEADLTAIVEKKTEEARRKQKAALKRFEDMQENFKMNETQRTEMEAELEDLRKQTLTAEEYAKREQKKLEEKYSTDLQSAQQQAESWQQRHNRLQVNYEISSAAQQHGVLPEAIESVEALLGGKTKIIPGEGEDGIEVLKTVVSFMDTTAEGKPLPVELSVEDTVKRMKENTEKYGYMFASQGGGLGGNSGQPGAKGQKRIDFTKLTPEEYQKIRKENPSLLYGENK